LVARRLRKDVLMTDYPPSIAQVNQTAPVPRRIRARLGGQVVVDTTSALYVWEWPHYPQYYIPIADVDPAVLVDEQHEEKLSRGTARRHGLRAGGVSHPAAVLVYGDDAIAGLPGMARFEWAALDAWYEEDEQVFVHPRDPYTRVDALRSTRRIRIELDGDVLAESDSPVLVFETGLPTRYYLNRTEVSFTHRPDRGSELSRHRLDLRLSHPPPAPDHGFGCLLQREGRHHPGRSAVDAAGDPFLLTGQLRDVRN